jgi:hypothetical protein
VQFHWNAAYEHLPLWQLSMRTWSGVFGQSEAMLRLLPALAGAASIPLAWYWLRLLWPQGVALRLVSAALIAFSPTLVLYAQEARMYTVVVLLSLLSLILLVDLLLRPGWVSALLFALINWLMVGFHYYSLLLIACEALFVAAVWLLQWRARVRSQERSHWRVGAWWLCAFAASVVPIALWMAFSPGFHATWQGVRGGIGSSPLGWGLAGSRLFFDALWRDLAFGAFRWQPPLAQSASLLLPLAAIGAVTLLFAREKGVLSGELRVPWGWLVVLVALLPLAVSVALFRTLAARYVLFIMPALYILTAAGVLWLDRRARLLGILALALAFVPAVMGLSFYFGGYQKSDYRSVANFVRDHSAPEDAVMLYGPRQHLLAKYYLGEDKTFYTAPAVELPAYWPVNAPPVVPEEMDGQIQDLLADHPALWLMMTAQDEVDDGEFVPKYLTAVAYKQDCLKRLDVELCRFVSPHYLPESASDQTVAADLLYNGELRLKGTTARLVEEPRLGQSTLYVQLDWLAERKPSLDYRVTLRLEDANGRVVVQRDDLPIGPLLPTTTWNEGDAKPGYMALPLPPDLPPGEYKVTVGVYDAANGATFGDPLIIARYDLPEDHTGTRSGGTTIAGAEGHDRLANRTGTRSGGTTIATMASPQSPDLVPLSSRARMGAL